MRGWSAAVSGTAGFLAVALLAGCANAADTALEQATANARRNLDQLRVNVNSAFTVGSLSWSKRYQLALEAMPKPSSTPGSEFFRSGYGNDSAWFDAAILGEGEASDGIVKYQKFARICSHIAVERRGGVISTIAGNLECPPGLVQVDKTVKASTD